MMKTVFLVRGLWFPVRVQYLKVMRMRTFRVS